MNLSIFGGNYTVDFDTMQQINDDTGTARHVQRKANPSAIASSGCKTITKLVVVHHIECQRCVCVKNLVCICVENLVEKALPYVIT